MTIPGRTRTTSSSSAPTSAIRRSRTTIFPVSFCSGRSRETLARQDLLYTYRLLWSPGDTRAPLLAGSKPWDDRPRQARARRVLRRRSRAAPVQAKQARRHDDRSCGCQCARRLHGQHRRRLESWRGRRASVLFTRLRSSRRRVLAHASRALPRVSLERRQPRSRHSACAGRELPSHPEDHRRRRDERQRTSISHLTASPSSAGAASTRRYPMRGMSTRRCSGC